ncbi:hypothetical protein GE09DRAFT_712227 [Coniochaeta sp. 2T2.1]|nr:hypothetical protein GE09DRAFT_712227 [Coniochaeta sp. 2T2.1]
MLSKGKAPKRASTSAPSAAKSPDSDVSPRAQAPQPKSQSGDYFSTTPDSASKKDNGNGGNRSQGGVKFASLPTSTSRSAQIFDQNSPNFHRGSIASSTSQGTSAQSPGEQSEEPGSRRVSDAPSMSFPEGSMSRKSSVASVTFLPPRPNLPQGGPRKTDGERLRASSPEPTRSAPIWFHKHKCARSVMWKLSVVALTVRGGPSAADHHTSCILDLACLPLSRTSTKPTWFIIPPQDADRRRLVDYRRQLYASSARGWSRTSGDQSNTNERYRDQPTARTNTHLLQFILVHYLCLFKDSCGSSELWIGWTVQYARWSAVDIIWHTIRPRPRRSLHSFILVACSEYGEATVLVRRP